MAERMPVAAGCTWWFEFHLLITDKWRQNTYCWDADLSSSALLP